MQRITKLLYLSAALMLAFGLSNQVVSAERIDREQHGQKSQQLPPDRLSLADVKRLFDENAYGEDGKVHIDGMPGVRASHKMAQAGFARIKGILESNQFLFGGEALIFESLIATSVGTFGADFEHEVATYQLWQKDAKDALRLIEKSKFDISFSRKKEEKKAESTSQTSSSSNPLQNKGKVEPKRATGLLDTVTGEAVTKKTKDTEGTKNIEAQIQNNECPLTRDEIITVLNAKLHDVGPLLKGADEVTIRGMKIRHKVVGGLTGEIIKMLEEHPQAKPILAGWDPRHSSEMTNKSKALNGYYCEIEFWEEGGKQALSWGSAVSAAKRFKIAIDLEKSASSK